MPDNPLLSRCLFKLVPRPAPLQQCFAHQYPISTESDHTVLNSDISMPLQVLTQGRKEGTSETSESVFPHDRAEHLDHPFGEYSCKEEHSRTLSVAKDDQCLLQTPSFSGC
jgi:hypothetical protein